MTPTAADRDARRLSLDRALRYVRASPLPHGLAAASATGGLALAACALELHAAGQGPAHRAALLGLLALGSLGLAGMALLDGFSRFREYRRIRSMLRRRGWNRRVFLLVAGSRCQRDAALLAAREAGHGPRARGLFHALGYRWYHLLPDAVVRNPLLFLDPGFLRSSFLPGKRGQRGRSVRGRRGDEVRHRLLERRGLGELLRRIGRGGARLRLRVNSRANLP